MSGPAEPDAIVVLVTAPPELAPELARLMVEWRVAACVVTTPVRSVYRWQGEIREEQEVQLVAKTTRDRFPALEALVRQHHEYEVPEILALSVVEGRAAYLAWVRAETRAP